MAIFFMYFNVFIPICHYIDTFVSRSSNLMQDRKVLRERISLEGALQPVFHSMQVNTATTFRSSAAILS